MNCVKNRSLTKSTHEKYGTMTPIEVITGKKPDISNLRIFGSPVKVLKPKPKRSGKFNVITRDGIHVGYSSGNTYRVFIPEQDQVIISRDVFFKEDLRRIEWSSPGKTAVEVGSCDQPEVEATQERVFEVLDDYISAIQDTSIEEGKALADDNASTEANAPQEEINHISQDHTSANADAAPIGRPRRTVRMPKRYRPDFDM